MRGVERIEDYGCFAGKRCAGDGLEGSGDGDGWYFSGGIYLLTDGGIQVNDSGRIG